MPRKRDERLVAQAASLAASGKTRAEIAAEMGVSLRTVKRWLPTLPAGRPRLADGEGSRWTRRRREREAGAASRTEEA